MQQQREKREKGSSNGGEKRGNKIDEGNGRKQNCIVEWKETKLKGIQLEQKCMVKRGREQN